MNDSVDDEHKDILPHRSEMKEFMVGSATESEKKKKILKKNRHIKINSMGPHSIQF